MLYVALGMTIGRVRHIPQVWDEGGRICDISNDVVDVV